MIDNAAYEDAKNEQARLEGRILELEQMLAIAKPISTRKVTGEVSLGTVVQLRTTEGREYRYTLVGAYRPSPALALFPTNPRRESAAGP